jgi:aminomethyltransferase
MMKKTSLYNNHLALNAKMVPFAGYEMPVQYAGLRQEHEAVRNEAGVFDVSHMGEFFVKGSGALSFLQWVTSNDVSKLVPGKVQYSCLPNEEGGIVDDLLVYCLAENEFMLVVNASNMEKDWNWLHKWSAPYDVEIENRSDALSLLAVQGPEATKLLQPITDIDLSQQPYYTFNTGTIAGIPDVLISATGYTGAGGVELYLPNEHAVKLWEAVLQLGIEPAGLGARDTLRLEKGFCLYGNDIDDKTSPIEAGLGWITKFNKDFINKDALLIQKEEGVQRRLIGFEMLERGIPRNSYLIFTASGEEIGEVRSGTQSPSLNKAIGTGYVNSAHKALGTEIFIEIRNKKLKAEVVRIPFLK